MPKATVEIPSAFSFAWDTVVALRELGGSGRIEEINEAIVKFRGLTEEQQAVPHAVGNRSEVEYRLAWARTLVKELGLISNSARGVWALSPSGQSVTKEGVDDLKKERSRERAAARKRAKLAAREAGTSGIDLSATSAEDDDIEESDWQTDLLEVLKGMDPYAFERLTKRLLREAGFVNVAVTGGSGDQGIDGTGVYRISPLLSFPVYFQCKRYAGSVGSSKVRDFRGAMIGRGDKGLLITTGTFTPDAKAEATRDGAPPLDLIDGVVLVELLREHGVGVTSTPKTVYDVEIDRQYFENV